MKTDLAKAVVKIADGALAARGSRHNRGYAFVGDEGEFCLSYSDAHDQAPYRMVTVAKPGVPTNFFGGEVTLNAEQILHATKMYNQSTVEVYQSLRPFGLLHAQSIELYRMIKNHGYQPEPITLHR